MFDEVQSGNGRTGHHYNYLGMPVVPDVLTTAKGLGNGVPIGACMARGAAADVFAAGHHGSTYGGPPLACAAAQAVIDAIRDDDLCARANQLGDIVRQALSDTVEDPEAVVEVRGEGLMLGIELPRDCGELVGRALDAGLLINVTAGNTVRLLPPMIMTDEQAAELGSGVGRLINDFHTA